MRYAFFTVLLLFCAFGLEVQGKVLRDRGESYHLLTGANTSGFGNIWLSGSMVGHVWDDAPATLDSVERERKRWISNVRGFAETQLNVGIWKDVMFTLESRLLGWGWKPGWVSGALKWTPFDNKELRLHGGAFSLKYSHYFTEGPPTIGGYKGFMPEGFVAEGGMVESWVLYEADMLAKYSRLPVRLIFNAGLRVPLQRVSCWQTLINAGVVLNGYDYDFFLYYTLEAFDNLFEPKVFLTPYQNSAPGDTANMKKHLVYFTENPQYITFGGNIRYENGIVLTVAVPLLVSINQQSRISWQDQDQLDAGNKDLFPDEVKRGIDDPFDPWFVKWKIRASVSFPLRYRSTSTELLRNYILLKNRKDRKTIDFDQRLKSLDSDGEDRGEENAADEAQRLKDIRRRREKALTEEQN